jgi:hypothetical protein
LKREAVGQTLPFRPAAAKHPADPNALITKYTNRAHKKTPALSDWRFF